MEILDKATLTDAKRLGITDNQLADLFQVNDVDVLKLRWKFGINPSIRLVDSVGGEHKAQTPYYFLSYSDLGHAHEVNNFEEVKGKGILIIGSGPNRIGQGIEFD